MDAHYSALHCQPVRDRPEKVIGIKLFIKVHTLNNLKQNEAQSACVKSTNEWS